MGTPQFYIIIHIQREREKVQNKNNKCYLTILVFQNSLVYVRWLTDTNSLAFDLRSICFPMEATRGQNTILINAHHVHLLECCQDLVSSPDAHALNERQGRLVFNVNFLGTRFQNRDDQSDFI